MIISFAYLMQLPDTALCAVGVALGSDDVLCDPQQQGYYYVVDDYLSCT